MSTNVDRNVSSTPFEVYDGSGTSSSRSSFESDTASMEEDRSTPRRIDHIGQQSTLETFDVDSDSSSVYSQEEFDTDHDERHVYNDDIENLSSHPNPNQAIDVPQQAHFENEKSEQQFIQPAVIPATTAIRTKSLTRCPNTNLRRATSTKSIKDPNLVTWDGPHDRSNPQNWPKHRQWTSMLLVSMFTFISPMASTMIAPALDTIAADFQIISSVERMFVMAIFLLAYAVGPFLWGPLSEVFGRVKVLQCANMIFLLFNTVCGFAQTKQQMMAFRFLSGIGGSAPQAIGGGVLADVFKAEERGAGVAVYSLMPFISPAIAPIMGAYLTQYTTWRWVFWSTSIFDVIVQVLCFFFLRETHPPAILHAKAKRLIAQTGNKDLHTKWQGPEHSMKKILMKALVRPFIMLGTQPALQAMAVFRAYQYGLMYLALATFPIVFEGKYNMARGPASLNYLSLGLGFVIGLQISRQMQDKIYIFCKRNRIDPSAPIFSKKTWSILHRKIRPNSISSHPLLPEFAISQPKTTITIPRKPLRRHTSINSHSKSKSKLSPSQGLPEHRLPLTLPFSLLISLGLFIYGFSAGTTHWIVPNIGACLFAIGLIVCFNCAQSYVVDTYTTYAASATGAAAFVRTMAGFSFPLFAPKLFESLGIAWANGLLGFVCLGMGVVAPLVLWRWGAWLRGRSTYCVG